MCSLAGLAAVGVAVLSVVTAQEVYPTEYYFTTTVTEAPDPLATGCPTVTATTNQCRTCAYPMCLAIRTLTQGCGCPDTPATSYTSHPCHERCQGIGCSTAWSIVTATGCETSRSSSSASKSASECSSSATISETSQTKTGTSASSTGTFTPPFSNSTMTYTQTKTATQTKDSTARPPPPPPPPKTSSPPPHSPPPPTLPPSTASQAPGTTISSTVVLAGAAAGPRPFRFW
ncbi:hypothetical protein VTK56DRAFT_4460 [Thermocarpiscus australiensis]